LATWWPAIGRELATGLGKDPRLVELILSESRAVVRAERDLLIVETHSGWICANAGIDASNVPATDRVTLLPEDSDASARRIRAELGAAAGVRPAVLIADSFGRPWRIGQVDAAIGCAGLAPLDDWRGRTDRQGRELTATVVAIADEVAAAADLARGRTPAFRLPCPRAGGASSAPRTGPARGRSSAPDQDLFRWAPGRARRSARHRVRRAFLAVGGRDVDQARRGADREHPGAIVAGAELSRLPRATRANTPGTSSWSSPPAVSVALPLSTR
jgi:coenzyme F420-0:L-glutamate ligase/coenzyme F420-1:gamma-L-glutamate ligase